MALWPCSEWLDRVIGVEHRHLLADQKRLQDNMKMLGHKNSTSQLRKKTLRHADWLFEHNKRKKMVNRALRIVFNSIGYAVHLDHLSIRNTEMLLKGVAVDENGLMVFMKKLNKKKGVDNIFLKSVHKNNHADDVFFIIYANLLTVK